MPFWSDATIADPKRQHRWLVDISAPELSDFIQYTCKKVNKPKMTVGEAEHKFINHTFYYPGGVTYDPITITMVDPANPHATQALYDLIQVAGYRLPSNITNIAMNEPDISTISKRKSVGALGSCIISQMDGNGNMIERIDLKNPWIKSIDYGGELSYESEGLIEIAMEIRFDWFELTTLPPE